MPRESFENPKNKVWTVSDEETVGGGIHQKGYDAQGNWFENAPENERTRYDNMATEAARRQAYQLNYGKASAAMNNDLATRRYQTQAADMQRAAAYGHAPSRAITMGNMAAGQSLEATLGASAGAKGMAGAAANMQAMRGMAGMQGQAAEQYGTMRAGELSAARQAYSQTADQMRGADLARQGLAQQRAEARARAEMAQRGLNQQAEMGYTQMGINHEQAQMDADLRRKAIFRQEQDTARAASDAEDERSFRVYTGLASAVPVLGQGFASAAGAMRGAATSSNGGNGDTYSDERTKQGASRASDLSSQLADGLAPYSYEYKPGFREREGQGQGETNIGPMAQNMARNPVTATAVGRGNDGMLYVDGAKATKLALGGIGELAAKQKRLEAELASLRKRK